MTEVFTSPNKDKIFKWKAYDRAGNVATGRTKQQALNNYYARYGGKEEISLNFFDKSVDKHLPIV